MDLDLSALKAPAPASSSAIILNEAEIGDNEDDLTVIAYGSEDLILTPQQRSGKTFAQTLEQYGPTIGMTFNPSKMTLRKESVEDENEDVMTDLYSPCKAGIYILSTGSDSKGLVKLASY